MAEARGLVVTSQHKGDSFTITTYIPPRRNGGPNCGAYGAAMVALAQINPDAFDPEELPAVLQPVMVELAEGVTATLIPPDIAAAMIRDRVLATDDDVGAPGEPPRCKTGVCDE